MLFIFRRIVLLLCLYPMLAYSKEVYTDLYLMTHPDILEREINSCEKASEQRKEIPVQCKQIMAVRTKFVDYVRVREFEPVRYGKYILNTQMRLAQLSIQISNLHRRFNENPSLSAYEKGELQSRLTHLIAERSDLSNELAIMYAAISVNSPD